MSKSLPSYEPEIWYPEQGLSPAIIDTKEHFNRMGYEALMAQMPESEVNPYGVRYLTLAPEGSSNTEAMVMFNPYTNGMTDNMMLRGEFIRMAAEKSGITDENGDSLPLMILASPALGSRVKMNSEEWMDTARGNLEVVSKKMLESIRELEVGKVALLGFSQGTETATGASSVAYEMGVDVSGLSVGDPVSAKKKLMLKMLSQFAAQGKNLEPTVQEAGVEPFMKAQGFGEHGSVSSMIKGNMQILLSMAKPSSIAIGAGMSRGGFDNRLAKALESNGDMLTTVAYGESPLTENDDLEEILGSHTDRVQAIRVEGANHTWGDNAGLLAKLYLRALGEK